MVFSKINKVINYPERQIIEPEDFKEEADIYTMELLHTPIVFALGRKNSKYPGIIYFPIYLVKKNNAMTQIGLFEIPQSKLIQYLDDDNNIDIEKITAPPLLYNTTTREFLHKYAIGIDDFIDTDGDGDSDSTDATPTTHNHNHNHKQNLPDVYTHVPESRANLFTVTPNIPIPPLLPTETKTDNANITKNYYISPEHNWLQKFMKNPNYALIDNQAAGDCFFETVRDAFASIGQHTTVAKLRTRLAEEATDAIFNNCKELYDGHFNRSMETAAKLKQVGGEYMMIKNRVANVLDRAERQQLYAGALDLKTEHDDLKNTRQVNNAILSEFKFMKAVDTLEAFKRKIQTPEFWADAWAIATMERILNVKFIILAKDMTTTNGDVKHVIQCGERPPELSGPDAVFRPDFYIILEYSGGNHYRLVSYKRKQIFQYSELPFYVKKLVVDKCLEKVGGIFSIIPDFIQNNHVLRGGGGGIDAEPDYTDLSEAHMRNLYDDTIVLVFYDKSADLLPGKAAGEKMPATNTAEFINLAKIPQWRRKLDDKWCVANGDKKLFVLDNHQWASVEHFYQASKFASQNPNFYLSFTLDSGTELSRNVDMARAAGGKTGTYKNPKNGGKLELLRPEQVKLDPDFYDRKAGILQTALYAKFTQNPELGFMLVSTKNAKLMHYLSKKPAELAEPLMLVREKIARATE